MCFHQLQPTPPWATGAASQRTAALPLQISSSRRGAMLKARAEGAQLGAPASPLHHRKTLRHSPQQCSSSPGALFHKSQKDHQGAFSLQSQSLREEPLSQCFSPKGGFGGRIPACCWHTTSPPSPSATSASQAVSSTKTTPSSQPGSLLLPAP